MEQGLSAASTRCLGNSLNNITSFGGDEHLSAEQNRKLEKSAQLVDPLCDVQFDIAVSANSPFADAITIPSTCHAWRMCYIGSMAKTLNHYSQQIRSLAPDAVALDRAKALGDILIDAKAAVKAAGKLWTEWLQSDCDLTSRTAGRFMTIAKRWNDQAFTDARTANPALAIREADKVLAASSTRKRAEPEKPDPHADAMSKLATIRWELKLLSEMHLADQLAGDQIEVANQALFDVFKGLTTKFDPATKQVLDEQYQPRQRRIELKVGDRCTVMNFGVEEAGTITEVHPSDEWSSYTWQSDEGATRCIGWGYPSAGKGSIQRVI